jgi:hypothetical protein
MLINLFIDRSYIYDEENYCVCNDDDADIEKEEKEFMNKTNLQKIRIIIDTLSKAYKKFTICLNCYSELNESEMKDFQDDLFNESNNNGILSLSSHLMDEKYKGKEILKEIISNEARQNLILTIYLWKRYRFCIFYLIFY